MTEVTGWLVLSHTSVPLEKATAMLSARMLGSASSALFTSAVPAVASIWAVVCSSKESVKVPVSALHWNTWRGPLGERAMRAKGERGCTSALTWTSFAWPVVIGSSPTGHSRREQSKPS